MKTRNWLKSRPGLNTAIGVVLAILAGLLLLGYLSHLLKGKEGGPITRVPVAARDIEMGATIRDDMLDFKQIPREYLVPGAVRRSQDITGKRALRPVLKGEPFTPSAIPGGNDSGSMAARIPSDLRAYSLQPGKSSSTGGELRPGDRVDVLSTSGDPPSTSTILRDRLVIGVGGSSYDGEEGGGTPEGAVQITLLVSPREAELLAQAQCGGEISIALCPTAGSKGGE